MKRLNEKGRMPAKGKKGMKRLDCQQKGDTKRAENRI